MTVFNEELMLRYINENKPDQLADFVRTAQNQNDVTNLLIRKMEIAKDPVRRQTIAIALVKLKCTKAVKPIIDLINKYCNTSDYSGLVYALREINCSSYIKDIFHLVYDGNYMVRRYTMELIVKNLDVISADDLKLIKEDMKKQQGDLKDKLACVTNLLKDIDKTGI